MRVLLLGLLISLAHSASAGTSYEMQNVVLLQPESVMQPRLEAKALAAYIAALDLAAGKVFATEKYPPAGGFLVVAVRPGRQSAAWLDFRPALPATADTNIIARLRAVPAPQVKEGPVVFAMRVSLDGGSLPQDQMMPRPAAWSEQANRAGQPIEVGDLVERVWPK